MEYFLITFIYILSEEKSSLELELNNIIMNI